MKAFNRQMAQTTTVFSETCIDFHSDGHCEQCFFWLKLFACRVEALQDHPILKFSSRFLHTYLIIRNKLTAHISRVGSDHQKPGNLQTVLVPHKFDR